MSPLLRPTTTTTKRKRPPSDDTPPRTRKRRALLATAPSDEQSGVEEAGSEGQRPPLTAHTLEQLPRDRLCLQERVRLWEGRRGRETARPRSMSSSASRSRSNPRKRSRNNTSSTLITASSLPTSVTSERTSTYDKIASDLFMDHHIYGPAYCDQPTNKQALLTQLNRTRRSLSPSVYPDSKFEQFVRANHKALNEGQLMSEVIHPYFTSYFDHTASTDLAFTNLEPMIPPPAKMPPPKPDHSFGVAKEDIHTTVRHALDGYLVCAPGCHTPAAVNDMMQVKGPDGKASVLETQITLDGALGERAMHSLHSYARGSACPADGVAHAFVQSYHAGTMKYYVSHRKPNTVANGSDRVYTTEIAGQYLCGSPAQLRDGIAKYRNSVELAAQCRRRAVEAANGRAVEAENARNVETDNARAVEGSESEGNDEFYDVGA